MKTTPVSIEDLRGVFPVPPLARKNDARRSIDFEENNRIVRHIAGGGLTRFLYGGNAFLYHVTLPEYEALLDWLNSFADGLWAIPSLGPSYGRAMDQASILRRYKFPCAMALPCGDPRDAKGLETGLREIAESANTPLILYLKDENNFGADKEAGLDVVARLVDEGVCVAIKFAVVRQNLAEDAYLDSLLKRVDRARVISGIGERPAVVHMRDWRLPGFTTGSGCVAPRLSGKIFEACVKRDNEMAEELHFATQLAGVAETGPVAPFLSSLTERQLEGLAPVARALVELNARG